MRGMMCIVANTCPTTTATTHLHQLRNVSGSQANLEQKQPPPELPSLQHTVLVLIELIKRRAQSYQIASCSQLNISLKVRGNCTSSAADGSTEDGKSFFGGGGGGGEGRRPGGLEEGEGEGGAVATGGFEYLNRREGGGEGG